jgi:hypothetical protein
MPNISNWISTDRSADAWARISDRPSSILVVRGGVNQALQTVRIDMDNTVTEIAGQGGTIVSVRRGVVFGTYGHPTVPDANLKKGDQFTIDKVQYVIKSVIKLPGEIQAIVETSV